MDPTRNVNLWLSNDEPMYRSVQALVGDNTTDEDCLNCLGEGEIPKQDGSKLACRRCDGEGEMATIDKRALADAIEELVKHLDGIETVIEGGGLPSDLLSHVLASVDWDEIAEGFAE